MAFLRQVIMFPGGGTELFYKPVRQHGGNRATQRGVYSDHVLINLMLVLGPEWLIEVHFYSGSIFACLLLLALCRRVIRDFSLPLSEHQISVGTRLRHSTQQQISQMKHSFDQRVL